MSNEKDGEKKINGAGGTMNGNKTSNTISNGTTSSSVLSLIPQEIPNMSTGSLETKLRQVRDAAQEHSQKLTQKLASSPSGQNLLHIGTSLSTLPPDLHTLLTHMHPFVNVLEGFEQDQRKALITLVEKATAIRQDQHRVRAAKRAADLYADLTSAEFCIQNNQGRSVNSHGGTEGEDAIGTYRRGDDVVSPVSVYVIFLIASSLR